MNRKSAYLLGAAAGALGAAGAAAASETVSYSYDALGRLIAVSTSGGPQNGVNVGTCYDPAGNRSTYSVATGGAPASCTSGSPPPPPPPSGNQPPTTVADSLSVPACAIRSKDVTANDTDPEGNYPLVLLDVSGASLGTATVVSGSTVQYEAGSAAGLDVLTYTVRDSLGATSTGTLNVTVTSAICN